jgi:hypothetical protein
MNRPASKKFLRELQAREQADTPLYLIGQDMRRAGVYDAYAAMVAAGESPRMAAMCASRQMAAVQKTDTEFARRERARMLDMSDETREAIVDVAKKAGINTHGKVYNGQLGKYNDPHAWVSTTSDVREVAKRKQLKVEGMVNIDARDPDALRKVSMAPDIKRRLVKQYRASNPGLDAKCRSNPAVAKELEKRVVETHGRKPR